jgi:tetratricopeptide (TPR) repeat protein
MKTILLVLLLAGAVSCPAQQTAQRIPGVDDIRDAILTANAHHVEEARRLFTNAIQLRTEKLKDPALTAAEKSNLYYYRGRVYQYRARVDRYLANTAAGNHATELSASEDGDAAIADFGAAIAADPSNAEAYRTRGEAEWDSDGKAIADFTAALKLNTLGPEETAETYFARGQHYEFDKPIAAIADYGSALSLDPNYAAPYYERGKLYDQQGHRDLAIADYSSVLPLVAGAPAEHFGVADAYYRRGSDELQAGREDLGIADLTAAIDAPETGWHDPNNNLGFAYDSRARVEERRGQYTQAIADYTKSLDLNLLGPDETAQTYKQRGDDYAHLGEDKKADADHAEDREIKHDLLCNQEGFEACSMDQSMEK